MQGGLFSGGGGACYRNFTVYKLVSVIQCKISSVTTAKRQFVQAIVSLQKLSTSPGGGNCPLARDSKPLRLHKISIDHKYSSLSIVSCHGLDLLLNKTRNSNSVYYAF